MSDFLLRSRVIFIATCILIQAAATAADIHILARQIAPGEPVRIVVVPGTEMKSISGSFLGQELSFNPGPSEGTWAAWAVVPLDTGPGNAVVEIRGWSHDGGEIAGTRAVTIVGKEFPEEHLEVEPKYVEPPAAVLERIERERSILREIYTRRLPAESPARPFTKPVPGERSAVFGSRRVFNGVPKSPHSGVDLRAPSGTPVKASGPGIVVLAANLYYSGNLVIIDHGGGLVTLYAHLSSIKVEKGERVSAGQLLGLSGSTGRITGPHLHWGAKIGGIPFDPAALTAESLYQFPQTSEP